MAFKWEDRAYGQKDTSTITWQEHPTFIYPAGNGEKADCSLLIHDNLRCSQSCRLNNPIRGS